MYLSEEFNISDLPVSDDITYIPYNYVWKDHKNFSDGALKGGGRGPLKLSFGGSNLWQPDQQINCLYHLKRMGLKWFVTADVDEYLWIDKLESQSGHPHTTNYTKYTGSRLPLHEFLSPFENRTNIGAIKIHGWAFGQNVTEAGVDKNQTEELAVDYVYRGLKPTGGRTKLIYNAQVAIYIGVHWLYQGGYAVETNISEIRWNHYRRPDTGIFKLSKKSPVVRDASLPVKYRHNITDWVHAHPSLRDINSLWWWGQDLHSWKSLASPTTTTGIIIIIKGEEVVSYFGAFQSTKAIPVPVGGRSTMVLRCAAMWCEGAAFGFGFLIHFQICLDT
jgi:hypothetical protein